MYVHIILFVSISGATHIYCHTNCISHNGDDAHKKTITLVSLAPRYWTVSVSFFSVVCDIICENTEQICAQTAGLNDCDYLWSVN